MTRARSSVISPPPIISSKSDRIDWMDSSVSTTSMMSGRSSESRSTLSVWTTLDAPKPATPRSTVAPASPLVPEALEQRLVQWFSLILVALSDEDAHQSAFTLESVRHGASCHNSLLANAVPAITAARQPRTLPPMYSPAYQYSPSPSSRMLS